VGIISEEAKTSTNSEFVKCFLLVVPEEVYPGTTKILQAIRLEGVQGLCMN
jgi:hypothetical protein